jgi:hypothetical protein
MRAVAIGAYRGLLRSLLDGLPVHALLVRDEGLPLSPFDSIRNFCPWQRPQVYGNVVVIHRRFGSSAARISCAPPWQSWQLAAAAPGFSPCMQTVRVSLLRIGMALRAGDLLRRGLVDQALHILVAIHAGEHTAVNGMLHLAFGSTYRLTVLAVHFSGQSVESEWQARQSLSLSFFCSFGRQLFKISRHLYSSPISRRCCA